MPQLSSIEWKKQDGSDHENVSPASYFKVFVVLVESDPCLAPCLVETSRYSLRIPYSDDGLPRLLFPSLPGPPLLLIILPVAQFRHPCSHCFQQGPLQIPDKDCRLCCPAVWGAQLTSQSEWPQVIPSVTGNYVHPAPPFTIRLQSIPVWTGGTWNRSTGAHSLISLWVSPQEQPPDSSVPRPVTRSPKICASIG